MSSLLVRVFQTSATGASKVRSTTSSSSFIARLLFAAISFLLALNFLRLVLALQFLEVAVQPFEAFLPVASVDLDPVGDTLERVGLQPARAPLRLASALDQARALEYLEVLGNGGQAPLQRVCPVHCRQFTPRQAAARPSLGWGS